MDRTAAKLGSLLELALEHPEGPVTARAFDRTFQFELADGGKFFMELKDGTFKIEDGDCGLDWQCRDWRRATCLFASREVLEDILAGRRLITEAYFEHEIGYAPHRAATPQTSASAVMAWLYSLLRLGHEQARRTGMKRTLAALGSR